MRYFSTMVVERIQRMVVWLETANALEKTERGGSWLGQSQNKPRYWLQTITQGVARVKQMTQLDIRLRKLWTLNTYPQIVHQLAS